MNVDIVPENVSSTKKRKRGNRSQKSAAKRKMKFREKQLGYVKKEHKTMVEELEKMSCQLRKTQELLHHYQYQSHQLNRVDLFLSFFLNFMK